MQKWLTMLAVFTLAAVVVACGGGDADPGGEDSGGDASASAEECAASIAHMGPLTGVAAELGQEQLHGTQIAVDQFNKENGTSIKLVQVDTELNPAVASTGAQRLVSNDDVVGVAGPATTGDALAVMPILGRADMPAVSMSAADVQLTAGDFETFFRVIPSNATQAPTMAQFALEEIEASEAVVVDDQSDYGRPLADGIQEELEKNGVSVRRESVNQDTQDFSAIVSRIKPSTDVVVLAWQIPANGQLFGKQMAEQGKDATIFGSQGLYSPSEFSIPGSYVTSFAPDVRAMDDPEAREFTKTFTDRFGQFGGTYAPSSYAAAMVVLEAIRSVCESGEDVTREAVLEAVRATQMEESILGHPISFAENGDVEDAQFNVFRITENGKYELVQ
jgi:branched-chain amino acid transport system substrate-binding protein